MRVAEVLLLPILRCCVFLSRSLSKSWCEALFVCLSVRLSLYVCLLVWVEGLLLPFGEGIGVWGGKGHAGSVGWTDGGGAYTLIGGNVWSSGLSVFDLKCKS